MTKRARVAGYLCTTAGTGHAKQPSSRAKQKALKVTRADAELTVAGPIRWKGHGKNIIPFGKPLPNLPPYIPSSWSGPLGHRGRREILLAKAHAPDLKPQGSEGNQQGFDQLT